LPVAHIGAVHYLGLACSVSPDAQHFTDYFNIRPPLIHLPDPATRKLKFLQARLIYNSSDIMSIIVSAMSPQLLNESVKRQLLSTRLAGYCEDYPG